MESTSPTSPSWQACFARANTIKPSKPPQARGGRYAGKNKRLMVFFFFTGYQKLRTRNKMIEIGSGRVRQFLITLKTDCAEKPACGVRSWCQKHDMTEVVCNLKWKTYGIICISHDLYDKQHGQLNSFKSQKPQTAYRQFSFWNSLALSICFEAWPHVTAWLKHIETRRNFRWLMLCSD